MRTRIVLLVAVFAAGVMGGGAAVHLGAQPAGDQACGTGSSAQVRTTLYFGTARPKGQPVSELEWQLFLRDEVTTRFPDGLTAWDAYGQWRSSTGDIDHDRAKVLLIVHPDTAAARGGVQTVITRYRKMFDQQSVLWETAKVCAAL